MKKYRFKIFFIIIILLYLFSFCEESVDYHLNPTESDVIVVNGILTNEKKIHEIKIHHPVKSPNEKSAPVSGALVAIYNTDSVHILREDPLEPGTYKTSPNYRAVVNKIYTLSIVYEQDVYNAVTGMLPVAPFTKLTYEYNQEKQLYTIDSVNQAFTQDESAMYEIQIDWTQVSGYDNIPAELKQAVLYYYSLNTIDISEVFAPEKEKVYFPKGTRIIESKYSLTTRYRDFIRSLLLETEWRGGLFDVEQSNVKTNLSDGALGFFTASTVIRDTFLIE